MIDKIARIIDYAAFLSQPVVSNAEARRQRARDTAREILIAMRKPTDLMGLGLPEDYKPGSHSATQIWRALIDAALKDE